MQLSEDQEVHKLVHMANQIVAFFRPYPPAEAEAGVRDHIKSFWTQTMCERLRTAPQEAVAGLDPLAAQVIGRG